MKISVMYAGLSAPHAGWTAIDELAELFIDYYDAEVLSPQVLTGWSLAQQIRPHLVRYAPLETRGGDVLIVVARGPGDLAMIKAIPQCRTKFTKIIGFVTDSYFHAGYRPETAEFDAITVTAVEDMAFPTAQFGIVVHQLYQGTNCLAWAPRHTLQREIDVMAFGRTPSSYQTYFSQKFHAPDSPHLYLHSPLGNLAGPSVHVERGMLFKLLHRSRISLAFHLFVEPQGNRPRSMMVTSRWLESLLSGCVVAGRRPISLMAQDMLDWPNATLELSDSPEQAHEELLTLLADADSLAVQSRANSQHMIQRHDWRYRIRDFCQLMELPAPERLAEDLAQLGDLARQFEN